MSILIKGMKKPATCNECKFFAWKQIIGNYCAVDENITFHAVLDGLNVCYERNGECPIIEVPTPHGRLIDADAILSQYNGNILTAQNDYAEGLRDAAEDIKTAPTIIEAEGEV